MEKSKLFIAVLYKEDEKFKKSLELIEKVFGETDYISKSFPFIQTDYYKKEMGSDLKRCFISLKELIYPDELTNAKIKAKEIEIILSEDKKRTVNLDPGYIDYAKLILATNKQAYHKIYLKDGVYADLTLIYSKGTFTPLPWTFPDFRDKRYLDTLLKIRELYKKSVNHSITNN